MAPTKDRPGDLKQEEILQAVVIADSFNARFAPATDQKPRALLPLMNVPVLDHTLDYLASEGVQETLIFCSQHSTQIRDYIQQSKWTDEIYTNMKVKVILAVGTRSLGDALKEINLRSLIRNDFFLLYCDTVTNVDLQDLMQKHKNRRQTFKTAAMTMTCMKMNPADRMRCAEDSVVMGVNHSTMKICDYQRVILNKKIKVSMRRHNSMVFHADLLDGQLYVCSPVVLHMFTDNFDFSTMDDLIRGIIINEEIYRHTVYVEVLQKEYCARISNPYMYAVISEDIMNCKTQPIIPQHIYLELLDVQERFIYLGRDVHVASTADLKKSVVIGKGSSVGVKNELQECVIGENCTIGANVKLHNCHVWNNVCIEDGCVLKNAILCDGVTVLANTTVQPRTLLSWNVTVGPNITLPPDIRLQDTPQKDEFDDDDEETDVPDVTPEYGERSKAFLYTSDQEDADGRGNTFSEWGESLASLCTQDSEDAEVVKPLEPAEKVEEEVDEYKSYYRELRKTLARAKDEQIKLDNLILEMNSLKHSYNIPIKEVNQTVVRVLVELSLSSQPTAQDREVLKAVVKNIEGYMGLLKHYIKNEEAQSDCLLGLEDFAVESDRMLTILPHVVRYLYNKDILDEDVILEWYHTDPVAGEEEEHEKIHKQMAPFITWLEEAEEESD